MGLLVHTYHHNLDRDTGAASVRQSKRSTNKNKITKTLKGEKKLNEAKPRGLSFYFVIHDLFIAAALILNAQLKHKASSRFCDAHDCNKSIAIFCSFSLSIDLK